MEGPFLIMCICARPFLAFVHRSQKDFLNVHRAHESHWCYVHGILVLVHTCTDPPWRPCINDLIRHGKDAWIGFSRRFMKENFLQLLWRHGWWIRSHYRQPWDPNLRPQGFEPPECVNQWSASCDVCASFLSNQIARQRFDPVFRPFFLSVKGTTLQWYLYINLTPGRSI